MKILIWNLICSGFFTLCLHAGPAHAEESNVPDLLDATSLGAAKHDIQAANAACKILLKLSMRPGASYFYSDFTTLLTNIAAYDQKKVRRPELLAVQSQLLTIANNIATNASALKAERHADKEAKNATRSLQTRILAPDVASDRRMIAIRGLRIMRPSQLLLDNIRPWITEDYFSSQEKSEIFGTLAKVVEEAEFEPEHLQKVVKFMAELSDRCQSQF